MSKVLIISFTAKGQPSRIDNCLFSLYLFSEFLANSIVFIFERLANAFILGSRSVILLIEFCTKSIIEISPLIISSLLFKNEKSSEAIRNHNFKFQ